MLIWSLPKMGFSFASALILRRFSGACKSCFLMYSHIFLVTSVRGRGVFPTICARSALGVMGFMNPVPAVLLALVVLVGFAAVALVALAMACSYSKSHRIMGQLSA